MSDLSEVAVWRKRSLKAAILRQREDAKGVRLDADGKHVSLSLKTDGNHQRPRVRYRLGVDAKQFLYGEFPHGRNDRPLKLIVPTGPVWRVREPVEAIWESVWAKGVALLAVFALITISLASVPSVSIFGALAITAAFAAVILAIAAPYAITHPVIWALALASAGAAGVATSGHTANLAFYEASAQVVPLAFVALAVYVSQAASTQQLSIDTRWRAASSLIALVIAEYGCLDVLARKDASGDDAFVLVVAALAAAATGLVLSILGGGDRPTRRRD